MQHHAGEPLFGLAADSTWRPMPVSAEDRGLLWAFGRLLALSLLYRSPCPVPLSLLLSRKSATEHY